jgi:hypothetical protein
MLFAYVQGFEKLKILAACTKMQFFLTFKYANNSKSKRNLIVLLILCVKVCHEWHKTSEITVIKFASL